MSAGAQHLLHYRPSAYLSAGVAFALPPLKRAFDNTAEAPENHKIDNPTAGEVRHMNNTDSDPFGDLEKPKGPSPFAIGFDRSNGDGLVFGGLFIGALLVVSSIAADMPVMALVALAPLAVAFWHYPMLDRRVPQIGANADGLFVERLGFIDWASIRTFELRRTAVRNIQLAKLEVALTRPLADAISGPQIYPVWKKVMMRNWSSRHESDGSDTLVIQLHTLAADPDQILDRLRAFRNV